MIAGQKTNKLSQFLLPSAYATPKGMQEILDFCLTLWAQFPEYRAAAKATSRYFVTDFEFSNETKEAKELRKFFQNAKIREFLLEVADEYACYSNVFIKPWYPFKRMLKSVNDTSADIALTVDIFPPETLKYDEQNMQYTGPRVSKDKKLILGQETRYNFFDVVNNSEHLKLQKINPKWVRINVSEEDGTKRFYVTPSDKSRNDVRNNNIWAINKMSKKLLQAIKEKKQIAYNEDQIFHFCAASVSGLDNSGWSMPNILLHFSDLYHIQTYKKHNELVAESFLNPMRFFSLAPNANLNASYDLSDIKENMQRIINKYREAPENFFFVPGAINYQEANTNGKTFAPFEALQYMTNRLLQAMGFPVQMFSMDLTTQAAPMALRIFENNFGFIGENFNKLLDWYVKKLIDFKNTSEKFNVKLSKPSMLDNVQKQQTIQAMVQAEMLPKNVLFDLLEIKKTPTEMHSEVLRERKEQVLKELELEKELEKEINAAADLMKGISEEIAVSDEEDEAKSKEERAMTTAQEWGSLPIGERRKAMQAMKAQNFEIYAMASAILKEKRNQGASEGVAKVNEEMQQS